MSRDNDASVQNQNSHPRAGMMRVLIDRNIERNAVTHRSPLVEKTIQWGDQQHVLMVAERRAYPPGPRELSRQEELQYLATVAGLAKQGNLKLYTAFELRMESYRQPGSQGGVVGYDLLEGIEIHHAEVPASRSVGIEFGRLPVGFTKEEQMQFLSSIDDPRFAEMRRIVGKAHMDDAFQLWTAETAGLDAFLTMDHAFRNVIQHERSKIRTNVPVLIPSELCERLGRDPTDVEAVARSKPPFC